MSKYYNNLKKYLADNFFRTYYLANKNKRIIKFLIAGGITTIFNLSILFFLTDILDVWYLASATTSYSIALIASFLLQKFWTFRDGTVDEVKKQFFYYILMTICTMALNLFFLYILVDFFKVYYILAQFVIGVFLAIGRFIVNNSLIFKQNKNEARN